MEEYKRQHGKAYAIPQDTDKSRQRRQVVRCYDAKCFYKGCNRVLRPRAVLTILHNDCIVTLRMHLYLYALIVVTNYSRRAVSKTITKDVAGKEL